MGMFREKVEHSGGLQIILGQNIEEWAEWKQRLGQEKKVKIQKVD
jgi:hypothetical protein